MIQFSLKALLDDDTRKAIHAAVLGEARAVARTAIDAEITSEVKRVGYAMVQKLAENRDWRLRNVFVEAVRTVLTQAWEPTIVAGFEAMIDQAVHKRLSKLIDQQAADACTKAVAKKLANKTVWEAEGQDAYVRKVVRQEIKRILQERG